MVRQVGGDGGDHAAEDLGPARVVHVDLGGGGEGWEVCARGGRREVMRLRHGGLT